MEEPSQCALYRVYIGVLKGVGFKFRVSQN